MFEYLAQAGGGRGGGGIPWQQLLQLLLIVGAVIWPTIRLVAKSIRERAKKRQAQEAAKRRQEQFLRTGRVEPLAEQSPQPAGVLQAPPAQPTQSVTPTLSSDDEAKRRLAEIYQRRRAELERLARGAKSAATPAGPSTPPTAPKPSPVFRTAPAQPSAPPGRPVPVFVSPTAPPPRRGSSSSPSRKSKQPKRSSSAFSQPPTLSDYHSASDAASEDSNVVHRLVKDVPPEHVAETGLLLKSIALKPGSPDLRRAFLLSEILGRPLSQRDQ